MRTLVAMLMLLASLVIVASTEEPVEIATMELEDRGGTPDSDLYGRIVYYFRASGASGEMGGYGYCLTHGGQLVASQFTFFRLGSYPQYKFVTLNKTVDAIHTTHQTVLSAVAGIWNEDDWSVPLEMVSDVRIVERETD